MNHDAPSSSPSTPASQRETIAAVPPRFPWLLLFIIWLSVVLVTTLVTLILPETYLATARVKIERDHGDIQSLGDQTSAPTSYDPHFIQTESEIIQSETILGRVIETMNLNEVWGRKYYAGNRLKISESLGIFRNRLNLRPIRNTSLLDIQVYSEDPKEAADIANKIAETYQQWRLTQFTERVRGGLKALEERARLLDGTIARAKREVAELSEATGNAQKRAYLDKQRELDDMIDFRRLLTRKMYEEEIDLHLPRTAQVMIIDRAFLAGKPVRPNVTWNIWLGILLGGLLGLLLAGLVFWLQHRAFRRRTGVSGSANLAGLRSVLRVVIGLLVGGTIGYNCALPLSTGGLLISQFVVFLGGLALAFVELAKSSPLPPPPEQKPG